MPTHSLALTPRPIECSDEEWNTRCELAALYRLVAYFRMTDLIDTHISARLPDRENHFLINRYGVLFHEMRASDLVIVDYDGHAVGNRAADAGGTLVNQAGFTIHSAIHRARPDLHCVIHTHTAAGIAVAAQAEGLLPISQHALRFYERLGYHDYEGIALDLGERERLARDLGQARAMILRNHGLLAAGATIPLAFMEIHFLERACQAQVAALAGNRPLTTPPVEVCRKVARQFQEEDTEDYARFYWNAAIRSLDPTRTPYTS